MPITIGSRFDRYEILAPLGAGGMGEVYLALDTRLERKVALKLLLTDFTQDQHRLLRFEQEAKTASALSHPNIITIHEIGECEAKRFITTEYVDGRTVRQMLSGGRLTVSTTLEVGIQIASALASAHDAGIIHRDIKPENVMVRHDSIVKVLDFGLAKLTERTATTNGSESPTLARLDTDPGTVMGTATYMSPEQARGLRVDARSDIFSLGVVLYEMTAGRPPFNGQTPLDVMTELLSREPQPLNLFAPAVPQEFQRIINKALRKDRDERYQTIKDLLLDLKSLKRELEVTSTLPHSINSSASSGAKPVASYDTAVIQSGSSPNLAETEALKGQTTSSAEYIVTQIQLHKRRIGWVLLVLVLLAASGFYYLKLREDVIDSIAVLPLLVTNTDADTQLLSDTLTDSIINHLSQLRNLTVRSRGAVLRYRGQEVDAKQISRELDVHAVLSGRIVQRGENLSVSIALVDARDDRHLWGEQYNRKIADLLLMQQEIAHDVSEKLRLTLSGEEQRRIDAHQLSLKGRNAWNKRTAESIQEGLKFFEQAIQADPSYAPAYAGLADCYNMLVNYSVLPGKETFPKAKAAAEKALSLDENLAEAHAALAFIYFQWEWNWLEAERGFKRAIELKPNYAHAHQWYSSLLAVTGRTDEALATVKRAQELDPFSLIVISHLSWINYLAHRDDDTVKQALQTLKLDPNFFPAHRYQALAQLQQGKYPEAIAEFQKAFALSRGSVLVKAELGHAYAVAGKRNEALQVLSELQQLAGQRHVSAFHLALIHTGLGEKDRAIELLNQAFQERSERMVWLRVDPRFDKLRKEVRFMDLLQRLGLMF